MKRSIYLLSLLILVMLLAACVPTATDRTFGYL